jgi:hypothetical protein
MESAAGCASISELASFEELASITELASVGQLGSLEAYRPRTDPRGAARRA